MKEKYGFLASLGELIRCPDAVRRALYNSSAIRATVTVDSSWKVPEDGSVVVRVEESNH